MEKAIEVYHYKLETPLEINPESVQLLIVENTSAFFGFVSELDSMLNGGEGGFHFVCGGSEISPDCGVIVCDCFHFDLNDKKILNLLAKKLSAFCIGGEMQYDLNEVNAKTVGFLEKLFSGFPFLLGYTEPSVEDLLKCYGVRFEKTYETLTEKIICFINAMAELKGSKFFVFVNLKSLLSDSCLQALYKHCALEKVGLLLVESFKVRPLLKEERAVIITEDLCEILENYNKK